MMGKKISIQVPDPLVYELSPLIYPDKKTPGELKAMYDEDVPPVMREDLKAALHEAGVDNIDYYRAVLEDPLNGNKFKNYWAFNVLGLVACADMSQSKLMGTSKSTLLDVDFDSLVIDEKRTMGLHLFRMAENISAIVVSDHVKKIIERHGIPGMVFYTSGQWSG